jgi:hypothetical protein
MAKILNYDPQTGITDYFEGDGKGGFTIHSSQDTRNIIKHNKERQNNDEYKRAGIKSDHYHFARVPNIVLMEWKRKYNIDWNRKEDLPRIEKLLNSPDYKYLRTVSKI